MPGSVRREHEVERLQAIRLHYNINTHLEDHGLVAPAAISAATNLLPTQAVRLLTRRHWREGNVEALQAIADYLGFMVRLDDLGWSDIVSTKTGAAPPRRVGSPVRRCG
ncbi:hypothetical protein E2C06_32800 [Dankookia rubra]|uniref:Uncharacterized protein n=1 Tax=Dankookia rubra TaxID=1442381 RepID=A0A4R5Q6T4_9PROT|nr:hypothetical protein [Dankookia rubra]TDH58406.1 hypothetical protein E2C06_32800 [Dankookia rubra]